MKKAILFTQCEQTKAGVITGLPEQLITNNRYIVRFAGTKEEVAAAQRLRYKVFNIELGEGLQSSHDHQLDEDEFDEQFHHLLVISREDNEVIGTYRMQTYEVAKSLKGFYTETEYDLSAVPPGILEKSIEVGRACIAKEHRNGRVLYLLWRGLARYLQYTESRYLFGCCSVTSQDGRKAWLVMEYLKQHYHIHPDYRVEVREAYRCEPVEIDPEEWEQVELPQLFRLYMDLGAKVCSPPAIDRFFKTIDYLVILDVENIDERTRLLFFR